MHTLTITRFTLQEAVSRRLILAGFVLSAAFLALFAYGFSLLYANVAPNEGTAGLAAMGALMTMMGLYSISFLASFLALFLSVGAVSAEIDTGTLHAVLARPLRRAEFILGRWLAYLGMMAVYVAAMVGSLLVISRAISGYEAPDPLRTIALMVLQAIILLSVSLFGSTLLSTLANGVVVFGLFGVAWLGGIIEFIGRIVRQEAMLNVATAVSLLIPSDAIWRGASYYVQTPFILAATSSPQGGIPFFSGTPPTQAMITWGLLYPLVFLAASVYAFSKRDI